MSTSLDRLRRLHSLRPQHAKPEPVYAPLEDEVSFSAANDAPFDSVALPPGAEVVTDLGACYLVTTTYPLATVRGRQALGDLLQVSPATLAPFHPDFGLDAATSFRQAAFVDTETTGLGGGAGIFAFMVGIGVFAWEDGALANAATPPDSFVLRQYFMRHPGEERALLAALADDLGQQQMVVTFNGRAFDLPLLRGRYLQHRRHLGERGRVALIDEGAAHLDLLYPARRLWRRRLQSCRLINLEQMILGLARSEDDVPGALIPQLYHDYLRTNQTAAINRIFYHNREDIVSMVALAHRLVLAYGDEQSRSDVEGEDWLALAVCYERQGDLVRAEDAYRAATTAIADDGWRADAFARLGDLLKRQERWSEAAAIWELWLTSLPGHDMTPFCELSKYCEWQLRDLAQAEMWAAWALHDLRQVASYQRRPGQIADLEHRLARIRRKMGGTAA
jgi:uncharacterized protein YprB with RNaseH-like and TPR domain